MPKTALLHWIESAEKIERLSFTSEDGALVFLPRVDHLELRPDVSGHIRAKAKMRALAEALLQYLDEHPETGAA